MFGIVRDAAIGIVVTVAFVLFGRWSYRAAGNRWARPTLSDDMPITLEIDKKPD